MPKVVKSRVPAHEVEDVSVASCRHVTDLFWLKTEKECYHFVLLFSTG